MSHKILVQKFSDENIRARVINQEWDDAFSLIYVPLFLLQIIDIVIITNEILKCFVLLYAYLYNVNILKVDASRTLEDI